MYDDLRIAYQTGALPTIQLGSILVNDHLIENGPLNLILQSFNRHGLIAGATGSGKTKTMQAISEQLSLMGVPTLIMDIKGDISGVAMPGQANDALLARSKSLNVEYTPRSFPVEFLTLNGSPQEGIPLRATVADFGPVLFSRMLGINDTQSGVIAVLFEYAKNKHVPLIDLSDIKSLLQFIKTEEGKKELEANYGSVSTPSIGAILRQIIELESQGADKFFGEPAFNVMDLVSVNSQNMGIISILRLMDMQDKPALFSTFMLKLLSDIYKSMPELGDAPKPKLVIFIDEAHLLFNNASKALLNLLDTMVKLIRSKGVGLIFCTQTPKDIPDSVLSQLGLKIQHALRAFTAKDRKDMKLIAQNFPSSDYYKIEALLTSLRTGEALVCSLDGKGQPTPLVQCLVRAPESRMGTITSEEINSIITHSALLNKYGTRTKTESAQEKLTVNKESNTENTVIKKIKNNNTNEPSLVTTLSKNTLFRQIARQMMTQITRAIMVALGIKRR